MNVAPPRVTSRFFHAGDGLRLHVRDYGGADDAGLPVVCLPGLSRSAGDFDRVARALCEHAGTRRRVVAFDYRGRGRSDYDPAWQNYNLGTEGADISSGLATCGIGEAIFLGTSRGGLHIMMLAAARPGVVRAAILNDIGPVLELQGLARIRGYIGKVPPPRSLADAVAALKGIMGGHFTSLGDADWEAYARVTFEDEAGQFGLRYDPHLMRTLADLDLSAPVPALWMQFDALRDAPLLVIRGANSDLLSAATLAEMVERHPGCRTFSVEGQGHAPLLLDTGTIDCICNFVAEVDPTRTATPSPTTSGNE